MARSKQLDDLSHRFEGIDPDAVKTLLAEKAKLEEATLIKDGEVEKLVTQARASCGAACRSLGIAPGRNGDQLLGG